MGNKNKPVRLTVVSGGRAEVIDAEQGENLLSALRRHGFFPENCCGGHGVCGKCRVEVDGRSTLACQATVQTDAAVTMPQAGSIFSENGISQCGLLTGEPGFALDIGTTTVALALADLTQGRVAEVFTADNPQRAYGADVMSRIGHCAQGGLRELHACLTACVNRLINAACEKYQITGAQRLYAAGNTAMLHLFFNQDCGAMGAAPYTPVFLEAQRCAGAEIGLAQCREVISLPCIASFVGADITAGIASLTPPAPGTCSILLDLGTNAEIALIQSDQILCTAAAAGPCFEGANISCGMGASDGAIKKITNQNGRPVLETIGGARAAGICGTGLIDAVAFLLETGAMDATGRLENGSAFAFTDSVHLTQGDIRAFQTAKSAVCSGVEILMERAGVTADAVGALYLAGGFSCFINAQNAAQCGLFPPALLERCVPVANSSLKGTLMHLFGRADAGPVPSRSEYVDLACDVEFSNRFMENMFFAETD